MPTTTVEAPATAPAPKPAASACACGGTVTGYRKHLAAKTTVCDAAKQAVSDYRRGLRERAGQSAPAVRTAKELEADVAAQVAEQTAPKETARDVAERAYARVKADDAKGKGKAAKMGTGPGSRAPDRFADKGGRPAGVKAKATPKPEPVAPAVEAVPGAVLVDARALKDALAPYKQVVAKRATLPVLGGVRLVAVNGAHGPQGHLFIQGTNLEATLETRIPAVTGEAELEAVVPFGALLDAASAAVPKSRNQQASVELRPEPDAHLAVSCGPMRQRLSLLPAEDFPRMMPKLDARGRDVDGATLAKAIAAVHVAISDDQARPILNAALLELGPRQVTLAATDSYRLAVRHVANQASRAYAKEERATLVQREALALAGKLFAKSPRVTLRWSRDLFAFSDERRALLVRPVEGDFPRFRDLIPNPAAKPEAGQSAYGRLEVDRQQLLDALDAFPRSMQQNRNPVHLLLRADTLELSGSEQDVATTSMTLPATWTGEPGIRAGFNPGFLRDGVAGFAEQVNIWIRDGLKPALLTPVVPTIDPRDTDLYLLMPVRLPDPAPEPQPKLEPAPGAEAKAASD